MIVLFNNFLLSERRDEMTDILFKKKIIKPVDQSFDRADSGDRQGLESVSRFYRRQDRA